MQRFSGNEVGTGGLVFWGYGLFMPRGLGDRPLPVSPETKNFAFISQFVEIPQDSVFTVGFSVRAEQIAVYP